MRSGKALRAAAARMARQGHEVRAIYWALLIHPARREESETGILKVAHEAIVEMREIAGIPA